MVWPGMGSEVRTGLHFPFFPCSLRAHDLDSTQIVFELYSKPNQSYYYIRVLWGGQPMKTSTPMGVLDMVPLDTFFACACYSFSWLPAENDEGWVDVDEMVGTEIDLYAGCNAL